MAQPGSASVWGTEGRRFSPASPTKFIRRYHPDTVATDVAGMSGVRHREGIEMTGVIPNQHLSKMIADGVITGQPAIQDAQIQPASLDLRLGTVAYRVRASFLAGAGRSVAERLLEFEMHHVDLTEGAVLEKGCVYVVPADGIAGPT